MSKNHAIEDIQIPKELEYCRYIVDLFYRGIENSAFFKLLQSTKFKDSLKTQDGIDGDADRNELNHNEIREFLQSANFALIAYFTDEKFLQEFSSWDGREGQELLQLKLVSGFDKKIKEDSGLIEKLLGFDSYSSLDKQVRNTISSFQEELKNRILLLEAQSKEQLDRKEDEKRKELLENLRKNRQKKSLSGKSRLGVSFQPEFANEEEKNAAEKRAQEIAEELIKSEEQSKSKNSSTKTSKAQGKKSNKQKEKDEEMAIRKFLQEQQEEEKIDEALKIIEAKSLAGGIEDVLGSYIKAKLAEEKKIEEEVENAAIVLTGSVRADFEKFKPFFDFLRAYEGYKTEEIGIFGSRVYGKLASGAIPHLETSLESGVVADDAKTDYDFFCISSGKIITCSSSIQAAENVILEVIEKFNQNSTEFKIRLQEEVLLNGKRKINLKKDANHTSSLNFKMVAIFETKQGSKECEFDLNFYRDLQAKEKYLQWQFGLERILGVESKDEKFFLAVNSSVYDKGFKDFQEEAKNFLRNAMADKKFLFAINTDADGFLLRALKKAGPYRNFPKQAFDSAKFRLIEEYNRDALDALNSSAKTREEKIKEVKLIKKVLEEIPELSAVMQNAKDVSRPPVTSPKTISVVSLSQKSQDFTRKSKSQGLR